MITILQSYSKPASQYMRLFMFFNLAEHTRHRSIAGFILNIMSIIAAYSFFPKKPSIKKDIEEPNPVLIKQLNQPKLIAA